MGAKRALQGQQALLHGELHAQRGGTSAQQAGFKRQRQQRGAVGAEGEEDGSEEGLGTVRVLPTGPLPSLPVGPPAS